MIYFTLTLTYQQLILLSAIARGELKPGRKKDERPYEETVHGRLSHFVTHARALGKNGLIEHRKVKNPGYTITRRGKLALELFKSDLAEASTLNILASKPPKMIEVKK